MTRVGWIVLVGILLVAGVFASMLSFSKAPPATVIVRRVVAVPVPLVGHALLVPVLGIKRDGFSDTWGQARSAGRQHHGTDIMAPGGTPVIATAEGTIEKLYPSRLGGITLYERSADRRWTFYYAHLAAYAPGIYEGKRVRAGEVIGFVGDTGDAGPGNYHLHFGLTRTTPDQHWYQGEDVNAFPQLAGQPLPR